MLNLEELAVYTYCRILILLDQFKPKMKNRIFAYCHLGRKSK